MQIKHQYLLAQTIKRNNNNQPKVFKHKKSPYCLQRKIVDIDLFTILFVAIWLSKSTILYNKQINCEKHTAMTCS